MVPLSVIGFELSAIMVVGAVGVSYFKGYSSGTKSRETEIVALRVSIESAKAQAAEAEERAKQASARVVTEYRDRIVKVEKEAEVRTELVEVIRRESANCELPGAYRELWDGPSGAGGDPAKPSARVNAAPVPVADAAEAAAEAKRRFEANEAKLIALQNYIAQIAEAPKPQ